jgi:hypothetical protein
MGSAGVKGFEEPSDRTSYDGRVHEETQPLIRDAEPCERSESEEFSADPNDELTLLFSLLSQHTSIKYSKLISLTRFELRVHGGRQVVSRSR